MVDHEVEVLVVGGGTVGLATAALLGQHGLRALVLERHQGPATHPRATGVDQRTAEIFRQLGLERALEESCVTKPLGLGALTGETLVAAIRQAEQDGTACSAPPRGATVGESATPPNAIGPVAPRGICPQNRVDRFLADAARDRGAVIHHASEVVGIEQDQNGVTVTVRRGAGGAARPARERVRCVYLVAADGAHGPVRGWLGIDVEGPGSFGDPLVNMYVRADLSRATRGNGFAICTVTNAEAPGVLVAIDGERHWVFHTAYPDGDAPPDFTHERCRRLVRAAVGLDDLAVDVLDVMRWRVAGRVARTFQAGRVFLVGDAAHVIPPAGAFGMNTGIADAHNLAWKLAHVVAGEAAAGLLDTYTVERRPVAVFALEQALLRMRYPRLHSDLGPAMAEARAAVGAANAPVVALGYRYDSAAVLEPRPDLPSLEDVTLDLDGTPGTRLPHHWVERAGRRVSTLDLVGTSFTLLAGLEGACWTRAAREVAKGAGVRLEVCRIGGDGADVDAEHVHDPDGGWPATVGITPSGAALVRPDGFIAWRATTAPEDPGGVLSRAVARLLGRV